MIDNKQEERRVVERALLVGVYNIELPLSDAREHLDELEELVSNLDIQVVDKLLVPLKSIHPRYFIGSGKSSEIVSSLVELESDCIVFDAELTPSQQRNWERLSRVCVIDRQEVILEIFAGRASTREAVLQVELAQLQYSLPRLTRAWTHLSRQRGGAKGTRGEGEKQIEADRRMLKNRITTVKKELKVVQRQRATQRQGRMRKEFPHAAIVGYTNAGKSSLLNKLTGANALVADKLFATLDPTTRKIILPNNQELLLTDTVGFVRKLPHDLIEAFKSTLEEAVFADFLLLVLDVSSPHVEEHWETTLTVLKELKADKKEIIVVFNKIDLQPDPAILARARKLFESGIFISVSTGQGLNELCTRLMLEIGADTRIVHLRLPPCRHDLVALAHQKGMVLDSNYEDNGNALLTISIKNDLAASFMDFTV